MYKAQYKDSTKRSLIKSKLPPLSEYRIPESSQEEIYKDALEVLNKDVQYCGNNFSSTESKLINIGKALLIKPDLLLIDEEALVSNDLFESALFDIAMTNFQDTAMLAILNNPVFLGYFPRVIIMEEGKILESGDTKALLLDEDSILNKKYIKDSVIAEELLKVLEQL